MTIPVMKCTTRADLLAVPAVLFGFHPAESCVVMGMVGSTVGFTARLDLDWHLRGPRQISAQISNAAHEVGADEFVILGYAADPDLAFLSVTELTAALGPTRVRESLVTDGTRYWSLDDGEPFPFEFDTSSVAAQAVYEGRVISHDRAEAVSAVETWHPASPSEVDRVVEALEETADPEDRLWELLLAEDRLSDDDALELALLLSDAELADGVVGAFTIESAKAAWPNLLRARTVVPEEGQGEVLAVLAMASWLRGGGAEYTSLIEQLGRVAPDHPVTGTLEVMHQLGIPPSRWSECG